jgi:hypothetical protein
MKPLDRFILMWIALALSVIVFQPFVVTAERARMDVNIAAVGGKPVAYGYLSLSC